MAGLGLEMRAIDGITQQGMADMGEMHPDLVGAAGFEPAGEEGTDGLAVAPLEALLDLPMRDRLAATLADRHLLPGARVAVDGCVDRAALPVRHAPGESQVAPLHRPRPAVIC